MKGAATRVYLTGADGMLGRALTAALAADRATAAWQVTGVSVQDFDIADAAAVRSSIAGTRPHIVVHAAANAIVDECEADPALAMRVNVTGTRHVTEAAREHGSRLVYLSSDYVFDGGHPPAGGYREDDVPGPVNVYGLSKLAGERIAATAPDHLAIRTSWLFGGPDERTDNLLALVRRARRGEPTELIADQYSRPTYTVHLARAIVHVLTRARAVTGPLHITNAGSASWYQMGQIALDRMRALGGVPRTSPSPIPVRLRDTGLRAARPRDSSLNTGRLDALGIRMPRWQDAVRDCCAALAGDLSRAGRS
ncbi:MAG: dTDP-4-dehydrorhamnose reductase [Micromonosporaceae bacterium]